MVAMASCLPAKLDGSESTTRPPVLVKDVDNLRIQVSQTAEGDYGVQVFDKADSTTRTRVPTREWTSPVEWYLPTKTARVVHAEVLPTGDVIVVIYSPEFGLDLVLLPEELFLPKTPTTSPQSIVFPKVSVPWHPTVSTKPDNWSWPDSDIEVTTPSISYPTPGAV